MVRRSPQHGRLPGLPSLLSSGTLAAVCFSTARSESAALGDVQALAASVRAGQERGHLAEIARQITSEDSDSWTKQEADVDLADEDADPALGELDTVEEKDDAAADDVANQAATLLDDEDETPVAKPRHSHKSVAKQARRHLAAVAASDEAPVAAAADDSASEEAEADQLAAQAEASASPSEGSEEEEAHLAPAAHAAAPKPASLSAGGDEQQDSDDEVSRQEKADEDDSDDDADSSNDDDSADDPDDAFAAPPVKAASPSEPVAPKKAVAKKKKDAPVTAAHVASRQPTVVAKKPVAPKKNEDSAEKQALHDQLAASKEEISHLRQVLSNADAYENGLWKQMNALKDSDARLRQQDSLTNKSVAGLQDRIKQLEDDKLAEVKQLEKHRQTDFDMKRQLENATHLVDVKQGLLTATQQQEKALEQQNQQLLDTVKAATKESSDMKSKLMETLQNKSFTEASLRDVTLRLQQARIEAQKSQQKEDQLQEEKDSAEARVFKLEQQLNASKAAEKSAQEDAAKAQAEAVEVQRDLQGEETLENKVNNTLRFVQQQLKAVVWESTQNATKSKDQIDHLTSQVTVLNKKLELLKKRAQDGDDMRAQVQLVANRTQEALKKAEAENAKLRGSGPWLERKALLAQREADKAIADAKAANQEKDATKAILADTQGKLAQMQERYASVVESLKKTQSKEEDVAATLSSASQSMDEESSEAFKLDIGDDDDDVH